MMQQPTPAHSRARIVLKVTVALAVLGLCMVLMTLPRDGIVRRTILQWAGTNRYHTYTWGFQQAGENPNKDGGYDIVRRGDFPDWDKWANRPSTPCELCVRVITSAALLESASPPTNCEKDFASKGESALCEYILHRVTNHSDIVSKWRNIGCSETAAFMANSTLNTTIPDPLDAVSTRQYFDGMLPDFDQRITPCPARYVCAWFGVPVPMPAPLTLAADATFQSLDHAQMRRKEAKAQAALQRLYGNEFNADYTAPAGEEGPGPAPQTKKWPEAFCPSPVDDDFTEPPPEQYYFSQQHDYEEALPDTFSIWGDD
jgi:hypothetical protein